MKKDIRIAAVVCRCPVGRVGHNLARTRYWIQRAIEKNAELVCFPEMNLTGYSNQVEIARHAIAARGAEIDTLTRLAVERNIALLVGFAEKDALGGLYASHMVITPEGKTGIYRKLHLAPPEVAHFRPGETVPVFNWSGIRFGIQLCYDAHFPELAARADIIFIPHASPRGQALDKHQSWMRHLPARAFDNGLFVVACNQTGDNENGLVFPGNAVVFSPSAKVIKTRLSGNSGILVADLTVNRLHHVRRHPMRYFFPNRRPELYRRHPVLVDFNE